MKRKFRTIILLGSLLIIFPFFVFSQKTSGGEYFDVVYQRCKWTVDPDISAISGEITFYFKTVSVGIQELVFNLKDNMMVDAVTYHGDELSFTHTDDLIHIAFSEAFSENSLDSLSIIYHGNPASSGLGTFVQRKHNGAAIIWTLSAPYGSEDWFPCKNDVKDKIDSTDIFITTPRGNLAASNGKLVSISSLDDDWTVHHWSHHYPIATYLLCLAVTNYEAYSDWYVRNEIDSMEILNYVYPESASGARQKTPATIQSMAFFERLFGVYPFFDEKYGHAQFGWGGGMEHQTMSFMVNFDYELITHELSHQWFGNMITCGTFGDVWLNEGFATYATALFQEEYYPNAWVSWKKSTISSVVSGTKGSVYCHDTTNVNNVYNGRLIYNKGAMVLHMLRWVIGDEAFFQGMWNYVHDSALRYGSAVTSDFIVHMEGVSGKDLTEFFDTWVYKEGYPTYTYDVEQTDAHHATFILSQKPSHESVACFNMPIPMQFIGHDKDTIVVFDNNALEQSFEFDPGFMVEKIVFDPEKWLVCKSKSTFVGISEMDNENFVEIYPNPFRNQITLKYRLPEKSKWTLSDMSGKVLKTGKLNKMEGESDITFSNLEQGMYVISIQCGKHLICKKILCE